MFMLALHLVDMLRALLVVVRVIVVLRCAAVGSKVGVAATAGLAALGDGGLHVRVVVPGLAVVLGGQVRVKPLLHVQHVQVGHVIVAQLLVLHPHHLHLAQAQADQQTLEALEVQAVLRAVAPEQLLDVESLLLRQHVQGGGCTHPGGQGGSSAYVWSLRDLNVFVGVAVAVVIAAVVAVVMAMVVAMVVTLVLALVVTVDALQQEGEDAQEAELGVHMDAHGSFTSGPLWKKTQGILFSEGILFFESNGGSFRFVRKQR